MLLNHSKNRNQHQMRKAKKKSPLTKKATMKTKQIVKHQIQITDRIMITTQGKQIKMNMCLSILILKKEMLLRTRWPNSLALGLLLNTGLTIRIHIY